MMGLIKYLNTHRGRVLCFVGPGRLCMQVVILNNMHKEAVTSTTVNGKRAGDFVITGMLI